MRTHGIVEVYSLVGEEVNAHPPALDMQRVTQPDIRHGRPTADLQLPDLLNEAGQVAWVGLSRHGDHHECKC